MTTGGMEDWLGGPCDLGPCNPFERGFRFGYQEPDGGGYAGRTLAEQERWIEDCEDWVRWRDEQCDESVESFAYAFLNTALSAGLCLSAAETGGLSGVGCAATLGMASMEFVDFAFESQDCAAAYPGPGEWP